MKSRKIANYYHVLRNTKQRSLTTLFPSSSLIKTDVDEFIVLENYICGDGRRVFQVLALNSVNVSGQNARRQREHSRQFAGDVVGKNTAR